MEEVGWDPVSAGTGGLLIHSQVDILGEKYTFIMWENTPFQTGVPMSVLILNIYLSDHLLTNGAQYTIPIYMSIAVRYKQCRNVQNQGE